MEYHKFKNNINYIYNIRTLIITILSIVTGIFFIFYIKFFKITNWIIFISFFAALTTLSLQIISSIFNLIIQKKFNYNILNKQREIVNKTKLPEKLPKVVFLYPTHNDFKPKCLEQSMKQTYKNFEVWISDGSDKKACSNEIDKFAIKHKINVFRLGGKGSINKADTMNKFLKYSGVNFDYLLICDADEIINEHFVEHSLKLFNSDELRDVGCIGSTNVEGYGKTFFAKYITMLDCCCKTAPIGTVIKYTGMFTPGHCSIYTRKSLLNVNLMFPNSLAEDAANNFQFECDGIFSYPYFLKKNYWECDASVYKWLSRCNKIGFGSLNYMFNNKFNQYSPYEYSSAESIAWKAKFSNFFKYILTFFIILEFVFFYNFFLTIYLYFLILILLLNTINFILNILKIIIFNNHNHINHYIFFLSIFLYIFLIGWVLNFYINITTLFKYIINKKTSWVTKFNFFISKRFLYMFLSCGLAVASFFLFSYIPNYDLKIWLTTFFIYTFSYIFIINFGLLLCVLLNKIKTKPDENYQKWIN